MAITTVMSEPLAKPRRKPFYQDMSAQVFAGMAIGALIGWAWPQSADWMRTLGDLFIRLISRVRRTDHLLRRGAWHCHGAGGQASWTGSRQGTGLF